MPAPRPSARWGRRRSLRSENSKTAAGCGFRQCPLPPAGVLPAPVRRFWTDRLAGRVVDQAGVLFEAPMAWWLEALLGKGKIIEVELVRAASAISL